MEQIGQYKFDMAGRVSCVAAQNSERPPKEAQGDLFLYEMEQAALEAWYNEPVKPAGDEGRRGKRERRWQSGSSTWTG